MSGRPPRIPGDGVIINGPGPHDWIQTYEAVALATFAALPLAVVLTWWLARRRAGALAWRRSVAEVGLVYGTLPWLWLTLLPASSGPARGSVSLEPLSDLATMPTYQVLGNLMVFAAVGLFAPIRFRALASLPRILVLAAICSVAIEAAQYVLQLGRVSSLDDVLLNTLGAGLAALFSRPWWEPSSQAPSWSDLAREAV